MSLICKKQMKIKGLIVVFLMLTNPLLIDATASSDNVDKSEINKKPENAEISELEERWTRAKKIK